MSTGAELKQIWKGYQRKAGLGMKRDEHWAELKQLWKSHNIKLTTKLRLMKTLVWPVASNGCESWTIKKGDEERIETFQMQCRRKILRVSWATSGSFCPRGGGRTPLPTSMGGHGRISPPPCPWIRHCRGHRRKPMNGY